jgi:drug/metabolite transporter (DMT)-like permease
LICFFVTAISANMIDLLLSIISSSVIFLTFKITDRYNTNLHKLITVNYLIASILGFSFNRYPISIYHTITSGWLPFAVLIGFSFILMFFLIGYSTRKSGIAVTTIAGKMSMVIPISFSILYFTEKATFLKTSGLVLATLAVLLASYRPLKKKNSLILFSLPLLIFLGSGITDSIVKYAQNYYIPNKMSLLFSAVVFLTALLLGLLYIIIHPKSISKSITFAELIGGTILGIANFGSLYFFIKALNNIRLDSSVLFGLNSLCIVLLSTFIGTTLFQEKLSKVNFAGIILALTAIIILMKY